MDDGELGLLLEIKIWDTATIAWIFSVGVGRYLE